MINSSGDPLAILTALLEFDGFETITTDEDKNRSKFYSTQPQREKLRENSKNFNKFLEDLKLELAFIKSTKVITIEFRKFLKEQTNLI